MELALSLLSVTPFTAVVVGVSVTVTTTPFGAVETIDVTLWGGNELVTNLDVDVVVEGEDEVREVDGNDELEEVVEDDDEVEDDEVVEVLEEVEVDVELDDDVVEVVAEVEVELVTVEGFEPFDTGELYKRRTQH